MKSTYPAFFTAPEYDKKEFSCVLLLIVINCNLIVT